MVVLFPIEVLPAAYATTPLSLQVGGTRLPWLYVALGALAGLALLVLALFWLVRWLGRREPYGEFLRLRNRRKLTFFRLLLQHRGVPRYVKAIPFILAIYLAIPFDLIPDFIPVLGYLDDVAIALLALVLIVKLTPRPLVLDLLRQAAALDSPSP